MSDNSELEVRKIWDRPVRLFHWSLAIAFTGAFLSGEFMTFENIIIHKRLGYFIGSLVAFRILWGFIGSPSARFASFLPWPNRVKAYLKHFLKREPSGTDGHNPIGGASVFALLGFLSLIVISGLFAYSDSFFDGGPLAGFVGANTQNIAVNIHHLAGKAALLFVVIHVSAIVFYYVWKRENLIKPMFTGLKLVRKNGDKN